MGGIVLLFVLLSPSQPLHPLINQEVEARGVEPLSEQPSLEASPCSVDVLISVGGCQRQHPLHPGTCLISLSTRFPDQPASLISGAVPVIRHPRKGVAVIKPRELAQKSLLLFVLVRGFYEANEPSSACSPELGPPVETGTPPFQDYMG